MRTVGMITIGQSPRDDVVPEMEKILGPGIRVVQAGALDGLSRDEVATLAPREREHALVTRLADSTEVIVAATQMKTGDRMYMQLRGCKFAPNGENLLAGGLVFTIRDKEWITVAPKELAKASAVYPKPRWGG